jgi:hypothetical protein
MFNLHVQDKEVLLYNMIRPSATVAFLQSSLFVFVLSSEN